MDKILKLLLFVFPYIHPIVGISQNAAFKERVDFKAKLELKGKILHGAGQSSDAFTNYSNALSNTPPTMYMCYVGLKNTDFKEWVRRQIKIIKNYPWVIIPQIGISMSKDGSPEQHYENKVNTGELDKNIEDLCQALKEWNTACFIRIGYGFNSNGYSPDAFKKAFIKISKAIKTHKLNKVAVVWSYNPDGDKDFYSYYPGDEYVDWWGIDLLNERHLTDKSTQLFLSGSLRHKKPVIIGESTPGFVGVNDEKQSWERWFQPYFSLIRRNPQIKAFCYVNWNWTAFPKWADWGDARIETSSFITNSLKKEMSHPFYFHGIIQNTPMSISHAAKR